MSVVDHPAHYGGKDNPYEVIKVIDAWELNFCLGNCLKYLGRAGKKSVDPLDDLRKAAWYLTHEIERLEKIELQTTASVIAQEIQRLAESRVKITP